MHRCSRPFWLVSASTSGLGVRWRIRAPAGIATKSGHPRTLRHLEPGRAYIRQGTAIAAKMGEMYYKGIAGTGAGGTIAVSVHDTFEGNYFSAAFGVASVALIAKVAKGGQAPPGLLKTGASRGRSCIPVLFPALREATP